jgi:hypothetical protein
MELACQTLNVATMEAQLMEIVQAVLAFAVPTWFLPVLLQSPITALIFKTPVIPLPTQQLVTALTT